MTGCFADPALLGAYTLRYRQSSLVLASPYEPASCAQWGPNLVARTLSHGALGCGAFQRSTPTGGAAYGMPRKVLMVDEEPPVTGPLSVITVRLVSGSAAVALAATTMDAAATSRRAERCCKAFIGVSSDQGSRGGRAEGVAAPRRGDGQQPGGE